MDISNVISLNTSIKKGGKLFERWFEFLSPLCKLTPKEIEVAAVLLRVRYELSLSITDDILLDKIVLSDDYKKEMINELNISIAHYNVIWSKFRKVKLILDNNRINPKLIPNIVKDSDNIKLLIVFNINNG